MKFLFIIQCYSITYSHIAPVNLCYC